MATLYFLTIGTNWNDVNSWSTVNATTPSPPAQVPQPTDDVVFQAASASYNVVSGIQNARNVTFDPGYVGPFRLSGRFTGILTLSAACNYSVTPLTSSVEFVNGINSSTSSITTIPTSSGATGIKTNGVIFPCDIRLYPGINFQLQDDLVFLQNAGDTTGFRFQGRITSIAGITTSISSDVPGTLRKVTYPLWLKNENSKFVRPTVYFCNLTDIDARDGETLWYGGGTISNCFNVKPIQKTYEATTINATGY